MSKRVIAAAIAFSIGWTVYMFGMMLMPSQGALALIVQPFLAAFFSALFVGLALVVGLILKIPILFRWWTRSRLWALLLAGSSVFILALGQSLGITAMGENPKTGNEFVMLHPVAALCGYFCLLFAVANWPRSMRKASGANEVDHEQA
jgi:hypothetical protein